MPRNQLKMKKTKSYFTLFFVTNTCDHEKYFNAKKTERIFSSFFFKLLDLIFCT